MFATILPAKKAHTQKDAKDGDKKDARKDAKRREGRAKDDDRVGIIVSELAKKNGKLVASEDAPGPEHSFKLPKMEETVYKASPDYVPKVTKSPPLDSSGDPDTLAAGTLMGGGEVDLMESRILQLVLDQPFADIGEKQPLYEMGLSVDISRALNDQTVKPNVISLLPGESCLCSNPVIFLSCHLRKTARVSAYCSCTAR